MRNFGQFCRKSVAASVLVLVLACSAFAGEMPFPNITSQPPATANGTIPYPGVASPTDTLNGEVQYPGATLDAVTGVALSLWQSALSLF